jgi:uncharacterized membrane protein
MHKGRLEAFSDGVLAWISLFPFVTGWMGENHFAPWTVVTYGVVLCLAGVAYFVLVRVLLAGHDADSPLTKAIGSDFKGKVSVIIYILGIALAFAHAWLGLALYTIVAIIWLIPDRRIEKTLVA